RALRVGARIRDSVRLEVVRSLDIALQDQPGLLDGHPAFEALRRGEWGPLIDASAGDEGTSASALWTWCRIASLVRMPAKQRRDALRHETALRALHWKAVLASTDPRNDQELWEDWLRRFGAGPGQGLYVHVMAEVERDLMGPPTRALKRWKRLVRVLEDTMDGSAARRAAELGDRIDSRLDDRVTFGSKVRSWAPGRRADGDSDGSGGPPGSSTARHPDRRRRGARRTAAGRRRSTTRWSPPPFGPPPPRPASMATRWSDVPSRQPDPCAEIIEHGRIMHDDVAEAIRLARAEGQAGDLDASESRMTRALRALRERRVEINAMAAQYRAGVQIERTEINKRGRAV